MTTTPLWRRPLHQRVDRLAVADDAVVVHERNTRLVRVAPDSGAATWDVPVGPWPRGLVVAEDRCLVLPATPPHLLCLDLATGHVVWRADVPDHTGNLVVADGAVLVGGWRGYTPVLAFDLATGRPLWRDDRPATRPLAVDDAVVLGDPGGDLVRSVGARDGATRVRWTMPAPLPTGDGAVFARVGADVVARCAGDLLARLAPDGGLDFARLPATPLPATPVSTTSPSGGLLPATPVSTTSPSGGLLPVAPVVLGDLLWLPEWPTGCTALDARTGEVAWRIDPGAPVTSVLPHRGVHLVASGVVRSVGADGRVLGRTWTGEHVTALHRLGDDVLAVGRSALSRLPGPWPGADPPAPQVVR
ncbi:PQQ-binding-like beta-propeller repeat protein [Saccharothrix longispora]|uniref:Outer membrane protein assembly factor BamB n=1 Tax=Saccharothrix longispora TaxID=33920 RepID=A0ABU1PYT2_9PSEU|nr:PQQ-binding-like beta-propeller repeat protein [Saccharothrix longispora]MDR6595804.1 outer membrane protein assembly factor BamB [Saccharothrix longispora]